MLALIVLIHSILLHQFCKEPCHFSKAYVIFFIFSARISQLCCYIFAITVLMMKTWWTILDQERPQQHQKNRKLVLHTQGTHLYQVSVISFRRKKFTCLFIIRAEWNRSYYIKILQDQKIIKIILIVCFWMQIENLNIWW